MAATSLPGKLVIVSGRSGSGKSTALHVLEDAGFHCIDNLPAALLPDLLEHARGTDNGPSLCRISPTFRPSTSSMTMNGRPSSV